MNGITAMDLEGPYQGFDLLKSVYEGSLVPSQIPYPRPPTISSSPLPSAPPKAQAKQSSANPSNQASHKSSPPTLSPAPPSTRTTMKFLTIATALASVATVASASSLVAYQEPYFVGPSSRHWSCGCQPINNQGSYKWYGEGQSARMYDTRDCSDPRKETFLQTDTEKIATTFRGR
ncbi:hypothetical protein B0O80DRAFT_430478 [Mortierella sp. GBAus27b]|nr:hypothetical protein B0O80DRAFT_430478 [Mortierella sp. GBAus27b]